MKGTTIVFGSLIVVLGWARPTTTVAQAVKPADLVGVWEEVLADTPAWFSDTTAKKRISQHTLTLWADSTWQERTTFKDGMVMTSNVPPQPKGRWAVSADTIKFGSGPLEGHKAVPPSGDGYKIAIRGDKGDTMLHYIWANPKDPAQTYKRIGMPQ